MIRGDDLRPSITDPTLFRDAHADDGLIDAMERLWSGSPAEALELLRSHGDSPRVRALRADCHRDLGDHGRALEAYDALVAETTGTTREAVMRQHRGKTLLAAGEPDRALEDFERAAELRKGGDPSLLASTNQALQVAREAVTRHQRD